MKKIKVTINRTIYYNVELDKDLLETLGPNPTVEQIAIYDQELFRRGAVSWDDLFDTHDVTFEGIDD